MTARYFKRPGDSQPAVHRFPENSPTFLGPVFDHFKHFFRLRTKIDWDDRVEKAGSRPAKDWQYRPPVSGPPPPQKNPETRKFSQRIARRSDTWARRFASRDTGKYAVENPTDVRTTPDGREARGTYPGRAADHLRRREEHHDPPRRRFRQRTSWRRYL